MSGTVTELANQPVVSSINVPVTKFPTLNAAGSAVIVEGATLVAAVAAAVPGGILANNSTIAGQLTFNEGVNAILVGPITVAAGGSITVPTGSTLRVI